MINHFPWLSFTIFLPLLLALCLPLISQPRYAKYFATFASLLTLASSLFMLWALPTSVGEQFSFIQKVVLIEKIGLDFFIGVDAFSLLLINLMSLLSFLSILYLDWKSTSGFKQIIFLLLVLQSLINASFAALNLLLFYICFELALVPMYFIIGIWGGEDRIYAAYKFFLYTLFGSLLFLACIIWLFVNTATLSIPELYAKVLVIDYASQKLLWWAMFIAFAIKIPMLPFHTWLPSAHVQAPTVGSAILAGALLKLGAYGFLRILLPIFSQATIEFAKYPMYLSGAAIIYSSLVAFAQKDIKKMIAYSSIAHMGYVTAGIFSLNNAGMQGAIFQMFSHGIISAALFFSVGIIYEQCHTKQINALGGLADKLPFLALVFMIFTLGSIGLPGTSGFIGELFCLGSVFYNYPYFGVICAFGVLLGATYMLSMYGRVFFGVPNFQLQQGEISLEQKIVLLILACLILLLGLWPNLLLSLIYDPVVCLNKIFTYYAR